MGAILAELWGECRFAWQRQPFAAAMNFLLGLAIGLFTGGSIMWRALS